ncbi:MarR family winged helix-turn-helix transcriptional regulator [Paenibacillus solisilvae]|uniref:MarR family winged helix-turn-helix transcriptional regulator n=1 Tax=Paenibacillus solisilvae TaxID=2486751 RepID=A0ABW0VZ58_9BACL
MTGPSLRFLIAIAENEPIRMSELAAKIGIKARTVTQFVDALEQENMLIRVPDSEDRRATFLRLTDAAPPLIQHARNAMSEASEQVVGSLSPENRRLLLNLLKQLNSCSGS